MRTQGRADVFWAAAGAGYAVTRAVRQGGCYCSCRGVCFWRLFQPSPSPTRVAHQGKTRGALPTSPTVSIFSCKCDTAVALSVSLPQPIRSTRQLCFCSRFSCHTNPLPQLGAPGDELPRMPARRVFSSSPLGGFHEFFFFNSDACVLHGYAKARGNNALVDSTV